MVDLRKYFNKKILILGLGREGLASFRFFLRNRVAGELAVSDKNTIDRMSPEIKKILSDNPLIKSYFGEEYLSCLDDFDYIIKSPGIPIHIQEIERMRSKSKIITQTQIFFEQYPGTIIGVTGTKGKSTTSSIIYDILKKNGKNVLLAGNIGIPMIDYLENTAKNDYFVCELSAHQLYDLQKSPRIAVILNIYPEHLDYYADFDEYVHAKANITLNQTESDFLIYNSSNIEVDKIAKSSLAQKIAFNEYDWQFNGKTELIGKYNLENAKIGAIIGRLLNIKDDDINAAISEFKPLKHRLEFIGNYNSIDFYNDSISTIQESAIAAIESLGPKTQTLIAGGFDRHQPFEKLGMTILMSNIKNIILFPDTGCRIWEEIQNQAKLNNAASRLSEMKSYFIDSMEDAVQAALDHTDPDHICVLSAASASFNGFRDYADRGAYYEKCLRKQAISAKNEPIVKF